MGDRLTADAFEVCGYLQTLLEDYDIKSDTQKIRVMKNCSRLELKMLHESVKKKVDFLSMCR